MAQPYGLLVAGFNYSSVSDDEFHAWYDTEHVPERERVAGFINAERWLGAADPQVSIATYDLESLDVLNTQAYKSIAGPNLSPWSKRVIGKAQRICRIEAEQLSPGRQAAPAGAGGLMMFAMNVVPQAEDDFNAWYDEEHIARLAAVPGCLSARRFRTRAGAHKYVAMYHLESPDVCASPAWRAAADTPWTLRIRPHTSDRLRIVLRRYIKR